MVLPPKFLKYIVGRCSIGRPWRPPVAGSAIQDIRCSRRALVAAETGTALRGRVEERGCGYVCVLVDVVSEALGRPAGRGRERCAPVASLLQAYVAIRLAHHVHFNPCGREGIAALNGACPAEVEGDELGVAVVD